MSIRYSVIAKRPLIFRRLTGLTVEEFETIFVKLAPLWQEAVVDQYKRPGRPLKMELADLLMMVLIDYRSYITHEFLGYLFGLHNSWVSRLFRKLEPLLAQVVAIRKERHLPAKEVEELILDATEQQIDRPKKGQKAFYSGKKKKHTLKTEIRITPQKRIVYVSKSRPGSMHDFEVHKHERPLCPGTRAYGDSGYQGLDKRHQATEIPYKKTKKVPLTEEEKIYNGALSRFRVRVEHVIGQLKTFAILAHRYRNRRKSYHLRFNILAGIVNLKNGFGIA